MRQQERGVTLIEFLLVIAIITVIAGAAAPFLSRFVLITNFDSARQKVISTIRKAQSYAMDGRNNQTWGVCISGGAIRLYSGTCATPTISENFTVPSSVSVSGLSDTTFNSRGEPSLSLSITVSSSIDSSSIQLNNAGGMSIN